MAWLLDTVLYTGVLIALALVLRRPVGRAFGPGMAYALWAFPLLRLLLPPLVLPAAPTPAVAFDTVETAVATVEMVDPTTSWWDVAATGALMLWVGGGLLFLAWRWAGYAVMRRRLLARARPVGEAGDVRLVESPWVDSPVAFGVRDKVVALPAGFMAGEDRLGRDLAIAHELEHHAGRDLAVNLAMQPLLALHWCNPLAWMGWRALRRDQEAACDARVVAGRDAATRLRYASLIAGYARNPDRTSIAAMACPISGPFWSEKAIVHRLRSLTMSEPTLPRRRAGRAFIGLCALALPATASITYAAVAQDVAPAAPAAPAAVPAAPDAPAPVKRIERIMVIEHPGPGKDKPKFTRTVQRGGKTIVIASDKAISDADLEARLARIDEQVKALPVPPVPPVPGTTRNVVIRRIGPDGAPMAFALNDAANCDHSADTSTTRQDDGNRIVVRTVVCGKPIVMRFDKPDAPRIRAEALASAAAGVREARAEIARDAEMPADVRARVLKQLDAKIAELEKRGS
ncbi:M56 family metallopeptidase [Parablastomonas sp. CN1-191]|uniref:M56 family metallopeptidase n=1 Tax=Parablastomonas sp. CN1-191 TaxID=3400908 RepID=UPI003BF797B1